jgi:hypothetical protein
MLTKMNQLLLSSRNSFITASFSKTFSLIFKRSLKVKGTAHVHAMSVRLWPNFSTFFVTWQWGFSLNFRAVTIYKHDHFSWSSNQIMHMIINSVRYIFIPTYVSAIKLPSSGGVHQSHKQLRYPNTQQLALQ